MNETWRSFFRYMICPCSNEFEEESLMELPGRIRFRLGSPSPSENIIEMVETDKDRNLSTSRHEGSPKNLKSILKVKVDVHREDSSSDEAFSDNLGDRSEEEIWRCFSSNEEVCTNPTPSLIDTYNEILELYKEMHSGNDPFTVDHEESNYEVPKALNEEVCTNPTPSLNDTYKEILELYKEMHSGNDPFTVDHEESNYEVPKALNEEVCTNPTPSLNDTYKEILELYKEIHSGNETFTVDQEETNYEVPKALLASHTRTDFLKGPSKRVSFAGLSADLTLGNETFTVDKVESNYEVPKALSLTKNKKNFMSYDEIRAIEDDVPTWRSFFRYMICPCSNEFEEESLMELPGRIRFRLGSPSPSENIIEMVGTYREINSGDEESPKNLKSILKVKVDVHREDSSSDEPFSDHLGDRSEEEFWRCIISSNEEVCTNPTPSLNDTYKEIMEQYKEIHSENETFTVDQLESNYEVPKALSLTKNKKNFMSYDEIRAIEDNVPNRLRISSTPVCFTTRNDFDDLVYNEHPSAAYLDARLANLIELFPEFEKEKKSNCLYKEVNSWEKPGISDGNGLPEGEQKLPPSLRRGRRNRKYRKHRRSAIMWVASSDSSA